tara:strand:+ start:213 stop:530 length:318 start_codon:yes stop_codon:yes gene_type:complete
MIDKTIFYYIILFSNFILNFSLIPLLFEVNQQKFTNNIPYFTILLILISQILLLFVVIYKGYYFHIFIYSVGMICSSILLFLKRYYDKKNTNIIKVINNTILDEE